MGFFSCSTLALFYAEIIFQLYVVSPTVLSNLFDRRSTINVESRWQ